MLHLVFNHLLVCHIFEDPVKLNLGFFIIGLLHSLTDGLNL